jgi:hypothetical protein
MGARNSGVVSENILEASSVSFIKYKWKTSSYSIGPIWER